MTGYSVEHGNTVSYANGYDVLMVYAYRFHVGMPEFDGLEDTIIDGLPVTGWKDIVEQLQAQSQQINKPWWHVPQAFGQTPNKPWTNRLPTYQEERFMAYSSVLHYAQGQLYWAHYRAEATIASPTEPYPYSGLQWIEDVWKPIAAEFNEHGNAIAAGQLPGLATDDQADILCRTYQDPNSGDYYLVALNYESGGENATFSLNLPFTPTAAVLVGEQRPQIDIVSGQFSDQFSDYQAHVYRLVSRPYNVPILSVGSAADDLVARYDLSTGNREGNISGTGLDMPFGGTIGPDGLLYVTGLVSNKVLRFNPRTGGFIDEFADAGDGLAGPLGIAFGPDGNCYVALDGSSAVVKLDGDTGEGLGVFAAGNSSGMYDLAFGPDGDLFVSATGSNDGVMRFDGETGAYITHIIPPSGLSYPKDILIDGDYLYVSDGLGDSVIRYNLVSQTRSVFISDGYGGLDNPAGLAFDLDGNLLVSSKGSDQVLRYDGVTGDFIDVFAAMNDPTFLASFIIFPGDANCDGAVDEADAAILAANWQTTAATWIQGDFNGDGAVNDVDATILASNWQRSGRNAAAVAEPSASAMMMLGLFLLFFLKRIFFKRCA